VGRVNAVDGGEWRGRERIEGREWRIVRMRSTLVIPEYWKEH
jgi:hypothetical protein